MNWVNVIKVIIQVAKIILSLTPEDKKAIFDMAQNAKFENDNQGEEHVG